MKPSQQKAIEKVRSWINARMLASSVENYGEMITNFEVKDRDGFISISAETELTKLPEGNLLRALDHAHWLFFIGEKGAITAAMGHRSFKHYAGKKYMGVHIAKDF